jgi:hypothetical protein
MMSNSGEFRLLYVLMARIPEFSPGIFDNPQGHSLGWTSNGRNSPSLAGNGRKPVCLSQAERVKSHPIQTIGNTTVDNTMRSVNQGPRIAAHPAWIARNAYALYNAIIDSNGNVQVVIIAGTSKAGTHPTWNTTVYGATADSTVRWRNVGSPATVRLASAGRTSGIIIENTVVTVGGAPQVYFSTQGNQACGTIGTGGCAVQASQSALN